MKRFLINFSKYIFKILKLSFIILIILSIILMLSRFFGDAIKETPFLHILNTTTANVDDFLDNYIAQVIPVKFYGQDWSLLVIVIISLIMVGFINKVLRKLENTSFANNYQVFRKNITANIGRRDSDSLSKVMELDKKFADLTNVTKNKDRKELLKEFVSLKNKLDNMGQECAFLSIDVVNSTGMKAGEDKLVAVHDFDRYNELAKTCLYEYGVIKFTTTPDGIMACFRTVDDAVKSAILLIDKIKIFNEKEKQIKMNFQVRCGINAGFVYIEGLPLEQVTDHVIDVAGHMQKNAKPNSINIAGSAIEPLKSRGGFTETTDVIDEQRVYVWQEDSILPNHDGV